MSSHKKRRLSYSKERCILSDVLPYEVPLIFTNRHFYRFLVDNKVEINERDVSWIDRGKVFDVLMCLVLGLSMDDMIVTNRNKRVRKIKDEKTSSAQFLISHQNGGFRQLSIPHPLSQVRVVEFYERYKEQILYYCSLSPFSIRYPVRIAKSIYYNDDLHSVRAIRKEVKSVEEAQQEYENLRSFFVYERYNNIYKFYESSLYQKTERKFNYLLKTDISKCFDSIYTHSLAWAILGKQQVKEKLKQSNDTFAGKFDSLMQFMNWQETHGILIGPEVSRIFSEIILQAIDKKLYQILYEKYGIFHKKDYEIMRYVDDYFIFFNDDRKKDIILTELKRYLRDYKLDLNSSKTELFEKPFLTSLSIAKFRICKLVKDYFPFIDKEKGPDSTQVHSDFLDSSLSIEFSNRKSEEFGVEKNEEYDQTKLIQLKFNVRTFISDFRIIIKDCCIPSADILNYTFSIMEKRIDSLFSCMCKSHATIDRKFIRWVDSILEVVFFLYASYPRVNSTIKLCRILSLVLEWLRGVEEINDWKNVIKHRIYHETVSIFRQNRCQEYMQIETLYLLIMIRELKEDYLLGEKILADYLCLTWNENRKEYQKQGEPLHYFVIIVLLFYMEEFPQYTQLRKDVIQLASNQLLYSMEVGRKAELTMLLLDLLACPYVTRQEKKKLLSQRGVKSKVQDKIIQLVSICDSTKIQGWFCSWKNFDFHNELDSKRSCDVY